MTAGRSIHSNSQDWGTPAKYIRAVKSVFGNCISLDPCSNEYSIVNAETEYALPDHDGLKASWDYPTIYVNPPYGRDSVQGTTIANWLGRCANAHESHGSEVLALIPVAANTRHWKQNVWGRATAICFLYDTRLKFLEKGQPSEKGAPMACAMVYWGINYNTFSSVFLHHGAVVDLRPLKGEKMGKERSGRQERLWQNAT